MIAIAGTTISPWQFFFQRSNVVDKRITPRWLAYERLDTLLGTILVLVGAVAIMLTCAWAFDGTSLHGSFADAGAVARGLGSTASPLTGCAIALAVDRCRRQPPPNARPGPRPASTRCPHRAPRAPAARP